MIPKIIHYCWFGGNELTEDAKKCIASWRKFCPDYEIREWNEKNYDYRCLPFSEQAYEAKKYAFVSDVARLVVLYNEGGIYLDTDVELTKSLDDLLDNKAYIGFENNEYVNSGQGTGSEAGQPFLQEQLEVYRQMNFINEIGFLSTKSCPIIATQVLEKKGLIKNGEQQTVDEVTIYPADYFNPYDDATGRLNITEHTHSIHWYAKSWSPRSKSKDKVMKALHRTFGTERVHRLAQKLGLR